MTGASSTVLIDERPTRTAAVAVIPAAETYNLGTTSADLRSSSSGLITPTIERQLTRALEPEQREQVIKSLELIASSERLSADQKLEMIKAIVTDITRPELVNQGMHATCTVTCIQHNLCKSDPVEYARIMAQLAQGEATLRSGDKLSLPEASLADDKIKTSGGFEPRSISERVFQTALMNMAVKETGMSYNVDTDLSTGSYTGSNGERFDPASFGGLTKSCYQRAFNSVYNTGSERIDRGSDPEAVVRAIKEALPTQKGVMVEVNWAASGAHVLHEILVTDISNGRVTFYNPHGGQSGNKSGISSMPLEEFNTRVSCAIIAQNSDPKTTTPEPTILSNPSIFTPPVNVTVNEAGNPVIHIQFQAPPNYNREAQPNFSTAPTESAEPSQAQEPQQAEPTARPKKLEEEDDDPILFDETRKPADTNSATEAAASWGIKHTGQ